MMHGWDRNRCRLHFTVRGKNLLDRTERAAAELPCKSIGAAKIGINNPNQPDRIALFFQMVVHTRVITAKLAGADDGYWYQACSGQKVS